MKNLIFVLTAFIFFNSCKTVSHTSAGSLLPLREAENYFVKNNQIVNTITEKVITTQAEFDMIFGMATYMGRDGQPTVINFSKENAIAIIHPVARKSIQIIPLKLEKTGKNELTYCYKISKGSLLTYDVKPSTVIITDKKYTKIHFKMMD